MAIKASTIDVLIWTLVYAGLLVVCLGVFLRRELVVAGWSAIVIGVVAAMAGSLLVWVRSRMKT